MDFPIPPVDTVATLTIALVAETALGPPATDRRIQLYLRREDLDRLQHAFTGDNGGMHRQMFDRYLDRLFAFLFRMGGS